MYTITITKEDFDKELQKRYEEGVETGYFDAEQFLSKGRSPFHETDNQKFWWDRFLQAQGATNAATE